MLKKRVVIPEGRIRLGDRQTRLRILRVEPDRADPDAASDREDQRIRPLTVECAVVAAEKYTEPAAQVGGGLEFDRASGKLEALPRRNARREAIQR